MKVGILKIQGDIEEHFSMTEMAMKKLGVNGHVLEVKDGADIKKISGLIIPGGESTVIGDFLRKGNLIQEIKELARRGGAIMGTCAGAILLAKKCDDENNNLLKLMDIFAKRNAYGRQKESFETPLEIKGIGNFPGVFIRAPVIEKVKKGEIMASYQGKPVMVQEDKLLAITFHPELTNNTKIHEYFLSLMR